MKNSYLPLYMELKKLKKKELWNSVLDTKFVATNNCRYISIEDTSGDQFSLLC